MLQISVALHSARKARADIQQYLQPKGQLGTGAAPGRPATSTNKRKKKKTHPEHWKCYTELSTPPCPALHCTGVQPVRLRRGTPLSTTVPSFLNCSADLVCDILIDFHAIS